MRLFLIGFMCAGKSRVGRELARLLELPFVDIDRVVEERVGPITPFIQQKGEDAFREIENSVLAELMKGSDAVIATGGGTPCSGDNMRRMKESGTTIWLDVPLIDLMPRIERAGGDRPLLFGLKGPALNTRVEELMAQRGPIYAQADIIVQAGVAPSSVAERIRSVVTAFQAK